MSKKQEKKNKLTPKKRKFVQEYILTRNATQAAKNAGYSEKTARTIGSKLLTNVDIQEALKKERKKLEENFTYTFLDSFNNFEKAQYLALTSGKKPDLIAFNQAEIQKAKLCNCYNNQNKTGVTINYMGSVKLTNGEELKLKVGKEPPKDDD